MRRCIRTLLLTAALAGLVSTSAGASIGAGVGATPLIVHGDARPGHAYTAPDLYVVNTGTTRSAYTITVKRLVPGTQHAIPAAWVRLGSVRFELAPRGVRLVPVRVTVPSGASSGSYVTNLVAATVERAHVGGATLGAAAAARLMLQVAATSTFPWLDLGLATGVLGLGLASWLVARSGLRLRVEREPKVSA